MTNIDNMFNLYTNGDGKMSYTDFIAAIIDLKGEVTEETVKKAFMLIAGSEQKYITRQQLFDTIKNSSLNVNETKAFLKQMDKVVVRYQGLKDTNSNFL